MNLACWRRRLRFTEVPTLQWSVTIALVRHLLRERTNVLRPHRDRRDIMERGNGKEPGPTPELEHPGAVHRGIVVVHGAGQQKQGDFLEEVGGELLEYLRGA